MDILLMHTTTSTVEDNSLDMLMNTKLNHIPLMISNRKKS